MNSSIEERFGKASSSYDQVAHVQRSAARYLVHDLLLAREINPRSVLDLGTGTGHVPELLLPIYPNSHYWLNDIASQMLQVCQSKFTGRANFHYVHSDMMLLSDSAKYDLITSNFALQWVPDLKATLETFRNKANVSFAFSTLISGTFSELDDALSRQVKSYPSGLELAEFCNAIKAQDAFDHRVMDAPVMFSDALEFMRHMKLIGATALGGAPSIAELRSVIRSAAKPIETSYKIFFGIFRRSS